MSQTGRRWLVGVLAAAIVLIAVGVWLAPRLQLAWHLRAARAALDEGRLPRALGHLDHALAIDPQSPEAHFLRAQLARRQLDYPRAQEALDQARRLGWPTEDVDFEQLLIAAQRGDLPRTVPTLLALIDDDDPRSALILEALAQGYQTTYRYPDAHAALERLLRDRPDQVLARYRRGRVLDHLGQFAEAQRDYERALELDDEYSDARLALGDLLLRLKRFDAAAPHFERLYQGQADPSAAILVGLARCRRAQGRRDEARELLEKALPTPKSAKTRQDVGGLCERALVEIEDAHPERGQAFLERALELAPADLQANDLFVQCLEQQGKKDAARMARQNAEQARADLDLLKKLGRRAIDHPGDVEARCDASELALKLGDGPQALRWLTGVIQQAPDHRRAHQLLVKYYRQTGDLERAAMHEK